MNSKFIVSTVVAIAALTGASAFAQSNQNGEAALVVAPAASSGSVSRAQVNADYLQARRNGAVAISNEGAFAAASVAPTGVARAQVRAEAAASARLNGNSTI